VFVVVDFVIDSVRKLLETLSHGSGTWAMQKKDESRTGSAEMMFFIQRKNT
jgi:hypothetical protein